MKLKLTVLMCLLIAGGTGAQTLKKADTPGKGSTIELPRVNGGEYEVAPGSKGNQLILTLDGGTDSGIQEGEGDSLMLWVVWPPQPSWANYPDPQVLFTPEYQVVKNPEAGRSVEALFAFDIAREASMSTRETVVVEIIGRSGPLMQKRLTLKYNLPASYQLEQNFPNPFNPITTIYYQLPADSRVTLKIYDILGREVKTLVEEQKSAGYYNVVWDATNNARNKVSSGVYVYRIEATAMGSSGFNSLRKMILLK